MVRIASNDQNDDFNRKMVDSVWLAVSLWLTHTGKRCGWASHGYMYLELYVAQYRL